MKKFTLLSMAASLVFSLGAIGCSGDDEGGGGGDAFEYASSSGKCQLLSEGDVYMGIMVSTGGDVWPVPEFTSIAQLAVNEINAAGLGSDRTMGAILCDSQCLPESGNAVLDELLAAKETNGIDIGVMVGPSCSYVAVEMIERIKDKGIALIAPSTESADLTNADDGDFYFRTIASGAQLGAAQGAYLANEAGAGDGLDKLAIVYVDDAWGSGMAAQTAAAFAAAAGTTVEDSVLMIPYNHEDEDASNDLDAAAAVAAIDTMMEAGIAGGGFLLGYDADTQFSALFAALSAKDDWANDSLHWELSNGLTAEFWNIVNDSDLMQGMGGITPKVPESEASAHFSQLMMSNLNKAVEPYWANTYDAIYMGALGLAMATDPTDGTAVRDALRMTSTGAVVPAGSWDAMLAEIAANGSVNYDGASGPVDFDTNGDVDQQFTHQRFSSSGEYTTDGCWMPSGDTCE